MDKGKLYRVLGLVGIGIVLLVGLILIYNTIQDKDDQIAPVDQAILGPACSRAESSDLMLSALPLLQTGPYDLMTELISGVEALDEYKEDPDCMFVLTKVYLNISNIDKAEESLAQLKSVYVSDESIENRFGSYAENIELIMAQVEAKRTQNDSIDENSIRLY